MFTALILTTSMGSLALAMLAMVQASTAESHVVQDGMDAMYVGEAAVSHALFDLANGGDGNLGSEGTPVEFGSSSYWVETLDGGGGVFTLAATGEDDGARAELDVVVRRLTTSDYTWAAFGDESVSMDSNAFVDAYDSGDGTYDSQLGVDGFAFDEGDVGTNADAVLRQNSEIWGSLFPGVNGTADILGNATVSGSTSPLTSPAELPTYETPTVVSAGDLTIGSDTDFASGTYAYDAFEIRSNTILRIEGPATLVLGSFEARSGAELIVDATDGPVEIYVEKDYIMNSNTMIRSSTNTPSDVAIYLASDNVINPDETVDLDEVDFDSNAKLYGTILAPNALIEIDSNFELFGSLLARRVHLDSNSRIHFDLALLRSGQEASSAFETLAWHATRSSTRTSSSSYGGGEEGGDDR